jgi:trimethylamine:corrinoid methyltransferase-like protein
VTTKRRRQGGSKGRRAAIANAAIVHHPELQRKIPIMEVTNQEGVELIHDFAE